MTRKYLRKPAFLGSRRFTGILLGLFILGLLFISHKRFSLFIIFSAITAAINYYWKLYHLPFEFSPQFFLQVVIARYYGLKLTLVFILLSQVAPKFAAGSVPDLKWLLLLLASITSTAAVLPLENLSLVTVGYISCGLYYVLGLFANRIEKPLTVSAFEGLPYLANNLIWFLALGSLITFLFS